MAAYYKCKSTNNRRLDIMDSFIKKVTFKDDTGKKHSYIATFVKVDGGYKISDEDMQQINEAIHSGATWEDASSEGKVDEDLEKKADKVKEDSRVEAHLHAISEAQDNGDGLGKAIDDIAASNSGTAAELYKQAHGDDAELYTDDEKVALGNIASAIKDRWQ